MTLLEACLKSGAIIGSVLMGTTLAVLVGTSPLKPTIPVWRITVPGALLMLARDIWADRQIWWRKKRRKEDDVIELRQAGVSTEATSPTIPATPSGVSISSPSATTPPPTLQSFLTSSLAHLQEKFPTATTVLKNLPLALLPFAFSMFTLVESLQSTGWLNIFASWWTAIEMRSGGGVGGFGSVVLMCFLSSILCNVCGTNIGTTILLARTLQLGFSTLPHSTLPPTKTNPTIYALAFGSNIGAYTFSFSASLAGLLWRDILRQKGVVVRRREFVWVNLGPWGVSVLIGSLVLWVQGRVVNV